MTEIRFGNLNARELDLRFYAPLVFTRWIEGEWTVSVWKLLNPANWYRAIFSRWNYGFSWTHHRNNNHRCYCPVGRLFDGRICIAGFGVSWFYSRYSGEIPCTCDKVFAEMFPETEEQG